MLYFLLLYGNNVLEKGIRMKKTQVDFLSLSDIHSIDLYCLRIKDVYNADGTVKDVISLNILENNETGQIEYCLTNQMKKELAEYWTYLKSQKSELNPDDLIFKSSMEAAHKKKSPILTGFYYFGWFLGMSILWIMICIFAILHSINNLHLSGIICTLLFIEFPVWIFLFVQGIRKKNNFICMIILTFAIICLNHIIIDG